MKCKFFRLIYPKNIEDAQSGSYTVALYMPCETVLDGQGNKLSSITAVGYYLPTMERMKVDMTGRWKKDAKYGLQFMMESYEEIIDPGKNGIVAYLSSGLIRGIGKRLAERIYNTFGDNTLAILDNDPDRIQEVPGISGKRSAQLRDSYLETRSARRIITLLAPLDINAGQAIRLQKELGIRAEELLKEHPYEVFERGLLPFDAADRLAERQGIPRTAPERVAAGLLHTLELAEQKGHLCLHKERFVRQAVELLRTPGLDRMAVANVAFEMLKAERLTLYQAMVALQKINAVEGFDPSALAVEYTDLNSAGGKETRLRLPVMAQIGWFRLKYPEGRIAVSVTTGKDCFVATARVYPHYSAPVDQFLAEATASRGYLADKPTVSPREWAQTAAVGIALRNAGFGLQFSVAGDAFDTPVVNELGDIMWSGDPADASVESPPSPAPAASAAKAAPAVGPQEPELRKH